MIPESTVQVSLVQLNTALGESMYLPYSVALLQAYAERHAPRPERYSFGLPMVHCPDVRRGAEALSEADIVGFSTYVWNANRHRAIARELRARNEQTLIVFGGPHVPDHPEQFLRENPFIDIPFPGAPLGLYNGKPWFLPFAGAWYKFLDWVS